MAACSSQNDMMVPPMTLFTSAGGDSLASRPEDAPFDQKKIMDIVMLNAFEGELSSWPDPDPAPKFSGLWWLPSFINHSCFRNASRLIVGEAMVVLAAFDIQAEEEITISYVDVLAPLKMREEACQAMGFGFCCNCKRCVVERSLENSLREESERFHSLYVKAVEEVQSAVFAREPLPLDASPACLELSEVFASLNSKVTSFANLTKLEKQWIIAGYSSAFLGKWLVSGYSTGFAKGSAFVNPTALELIEAMKSAVPGMLRTLSFTMLLVFLAQRTKASQALATRLFRLGMDECMRVYGKQKQDVMLQLMAQSSEVVPFF